MKDFQLKKLYYSISEVSRALALEPYVLRYWETEFDQLKPQKNRAGNRIYTDKDIELIRLIKKLTREDRYTIPGARQVLEAMLAAIAAGTEPEIPPVPKASGTEQPPEQIGEKSLQEDLISIRSALTQLLERLEPDQDASPI